MPRAAHGYPLPPREGLVSTMKHREPLKTLVEKGQKGDPEAFKEIVARFETYARESAFRIVRDYHTAQDIAQEAFTEAFAKLHQLNTPAAFPGWFQRIVLKHTDRVTRKKTFSTCPLDNELYAADHRRDPLRTLLLEELKEAVRDAVEGLPERERESMEQFYGGQASQKIIARDHATTVGAIKKRLYTARRRMRPAVEDFEEEFGAHGVLDAGPTLTPEEQLFSAAWNGYSAKALGLVETDPSLKTATNDDGLSILLFAAHAAHFHGDDGVITVLLAAGAPIDFISAAALGMDKAVAMFLRNKRNDVNETDPWGRPPIVWAAAGGHTDLVDRLLSNGADVNAADEWGCTALHQAAEFGRLPTVELLLKRGAIVHKKLKNGKTPIHLAAQRSDIPVLERLLQSGASLDLFAIAGLGWLSESEKMMVKNPILIESRLALGATPLHVAAECGHGELARRFIGYGAEMDLHTAVELGWREEMRALINGSPTMIQRRGGSFGFTALHTASIKGKHRLARTLLARGAEVNARDSMYIKTPLREALHFGNETMAALLRRHGGHV